ncbi:MAG TPA: GNAT family N-acetyltransferase [Hyphomicrobiaceae bacterium]|jgi:GNAT superfamily N-acetyltransferase|nr:GNAT family N-acetyltransferase [Hyphomicrobiaceae bacterium]
MRTPSSVECAEPSDEGIRTAELVQLRLIDIDDWSDVRYVHGTSFRTIVAPRATPRYVEAFMSRLDTPAYVEELHGTDLTGAWLDGQLAGTAGWRPLDSRGRVARIEGLFVLPLFSFMGLGSLLLAHAEARARRAGYTSITALACAPSVPFFMRAGYDVYAQGHGVCELADDVTMFVMRKPETAASIALTRDAGAPKVQLPDAATMEMALLSTSEPAPRRRALLIEE